MLFMDSVCLDFLNSEFRDFRGRWVRDDLLQPDWLEQFLARWGLQIADPLDPATLEALLALRALLARVVDDLAGGRQPSPADLETLNIFMLKVPLGRRLKLADKQYCLELVPIKKNWDWVQEEIVASFADLLTNYDLRRIKICANAHCRSVFYDESKSRTRRYCTIDKCANLVKVRRFRARHRDNIKKGQSLAGQ